MQRRKKGHRKKQRLREKRAVNGRRGAFGEVLREVEVRLGQCCLAHGLGGLARCRVAGDRTLVMIRAMATDGVEVLF